MTKKEGEMMHEMWKKYPLIQAELRKTNLRMKQSIRIKNKDVEQAILNMIAQGGKMLRPAYQLLFSRFGKEQDFEKKIALAASVEMLHTATLVHDDIVDMSSSRRGLPTIAHAFGVDVAVYAGDYLFISCFKLLSQHLSSLRSMEIHSKNIENILNGELGQMNERYNLEVQIDGYIENIAGKTAELFAMSCMIGAYESGCDALFSKKVYDIGKNIGIAFQIMDDYLDYTSASSVVGKPVLEDMRQGIYSLPLIYAMKESPVVIKSYLLRKEEMSDSDLRRVIELLKKTSALEKTKAFANQYTGKAIQEMKKLPDDTLHTRETLIDITQTILERIN